MFQFIQNLIDKLIPWLAIHVPRVILVFMVACLVKWLVNVFLEKIVRKAIVSNNYLSPEAEKKREDTLIAVFDALFKVVIWSVALVMIIGEMGINIGPILAGAGILGLAIGFGAQYLVSDFISGLFIILENQYRVGDVISVGDKAGMVEDVNLRVTKLRDASGTLHYIPNGSIRIASNLTKDFAKLNLTIGVGYNTNLKKLEKVVGRVCDKLVREKEWHYKFIEKPKFIKIDDFADSAMIVKIDGRVKPLEQWTITAELRKRLKLAFDKEGIEIPYPQLVVHSRKQ